MWGILYKILSIPHNIVMYLNNVIRHELHEIHIKNYIYLYLYLYTIKKEKGKVIGCLQYWVMIAKLYNKW